MGTIITTNFTQMHQFHEWTFAMKKYGSFNPIDIGPEADHENGSSFRLPDMLSVRVDSPTLAASVAFSIPLLLQALLLKCTGKLLQLVEHMLTENQRCPTNYTLISSACLLLVLYIGQRLIGPFDYGNGGMWYNKLDWQTLTILLINSLFFRNLKIF